MNKVLLEIYVPAIQDRFDIFAPIDVPIKELSVILANSVAELTNEKYLPSGKEQLCLREPAGLLNPALTLQDFGVKDGMRIFLI